jgi:predicted phage-related endonuclease
MNAIPIVHDSPEWHALRARHIGGSEVAALYDLPPAERPAYLTTRFALWHIKKGNIPRPVVDNPRAKWGNRLEAVIAEIAAAERGWKIHKGGYVTDATTPGLGCTLDFDIEEPGPLEIKLGFSGPGIMEVKNIDWMVHRRSWTDAEPPFHILLQLLHQLAATGYSWGVVAGLIGGNNLQYYPYAARPLLITDIRRRVREFWASIDANQEPRVDGSDSASEALAALYPDIIDDAVDLSSSNEWPEAVAAMIVASGARKEANADYDDAKNRVVELLAGHKRAWGAGYSVSTAITPEKPDRPALPGEIIKGKAEVRRYTAKETKL